MSEGDGASARRGLSRRSFIGGTAFGAAATAAIHAGAHRSSPAHPEEAAAQGPAAGGRVREYWVVAEPRRWQPSPTGFDDWRGKRVPRAIRRKSFMALTYVATEPGWGRPLPPGGVGDNTGIPGPVIRANVGDEVLVHFKNNDHHHRDPHTMHFHGFKYGPESDGAFLGRYTPPGGAVRFGETFTYRLRAIEESVGVWPYHDHGVHEVGSAGAGLFGAIVIPPPDEPPADVEATVYFHMLQPDITGFERAFSAINGRAFAGNTPTVKARVGQTVQFNAFAIGSEFHTFHIHGHRWLEAGPGGKSTGKPVDNPTLGPAEGIKARFVEDAPGRWIYHCHVFDHMMDGMLGFYLVEGAGAAPASRSSSGNGRARRPGGH